MLCMCIAIWSFGVGGNIPVDSTVFIGRWPLPEFTTGCEIYVPIEFVPTSHRYMLTVLSVWWSLGDLVGSLVSYLESMR